MIDKGEKLSIIGIFSHIGAKTAPIRHRHLAFVVVFQATRADYNREREIEIEIVDQDGRPITDKIQASIRIDGEPLLPPTVPMILNVEDLTFPDFGPYTFNIYIAGDAKKTLRLDVIQTDPEAV